MYYGNYSAEDLADIKRDEARAAWDDEVRKIARKDKEFRRVEEILEFTEDKTGAAWLRLRVKIEQIRQNMLDSASEALSEWKEEEKYQRSHRYI